MVSSWDIHSEVLVSYLLRTLVLMLSPVLVLGSCGSDEEEAAPRP